MTDFCRNLASPPAPQPLQPRALYEALADRVRDRILNHELRPGTPIDEVALLGEYGVSRTPVREALKLLHHEGLLTARPRRGMFVTELDAPAREEAARMYRLLIAHAPAGGAPAPDSLQGRMLAMAEQQLRLAYGPAFEKRVRGTIGGHAPAAAQASAVGSSSP